MMHSNDESFSADLDDVATRLRDERPAATPLELDRIKRRAQAGAARPAGGLKRQKGPIMKSRIAVTAVISLGVLFSTGGAGLALSGLSSNDPSAQKTQYSPEQVVSPEERSGTNPGNAGGSDPLGSGGGEPQGQTLAQTAEGGPTEPGEAQPARQAAANGGGEELPMTGFAAIPVLLGGVALLGTGVALRRRMD